MNLLTLSLRNLFSRPLSTLMSLLLLTLGVSIISLLLLLNRQLDEQFTQNIQGIDMVVGAKGSPLQLILSSVYHIDNPTGNISLAEANKLAKHPLVEKAIPLSYGDSYEGYRIVGTDTQYVAHYGGVLAQGKTWGHSFEAVLGAEVSQRVGLSIGDTFYGSHGLANANEIHDAHAFTVVGVLAPSGTVLDQLILTATQSVWDTHGSHDEGVTHGAEHAEEEHDHAHEAGHDHDHEEEEREITAMLISFRSAMGMVMLPRMINEQTSMQAALPAIEINRLFGLFAVGIDTLRAIALAIMVISGISVFVSLYNSLRERRYEMALIRSLGGARWQLLLMLLLEGMILSVLGFLAGVLLARGGIFLIDRLARDAYHYRLDTVAWLPGETYLFGACLLIGIVAAAIPAWEAFRLNISRTLSGE